MRDLTKAELQDYFAWARSDVKASDYRRDQAQLIGEVIEDCGLMDPLARKLKLAMDRGTFTPNDLMLSTFVAFFQMGRECESRLLTLALKGRK